MPSPANWLLKCLLDLRGRPSKAYCCYSVARESWWFEPYVSRIVSILVCVRFDQEDINANSSMQYITLSHENLTLRRIVV